MKRSNFVKIGIIVLIILLAVDIGSRIFVGTEANAAGKVQYKVVSASNINTPAQYEQLLNQMADQGWTFDHVVAIADMEVVFRR